MLKIVVLLLFIFTLSHSALGDQPRIQNLFVSPDGKYEAKMENDRVWRLLEKATGKESYRFSDYYRDGIWFSSMTLVISDDGSSIVAVNDYGEQNVEKNPDILFFFKDGKLFKTYKVQDLVNPKLMSFSVSHFRWVFSADKLVVNNSRLELTTFEMNRFIFDTGSGSLLTKEEDVIFSKGGNFVYGEVRSLGGDRFEIAVECTVRGNAKKGSRLVFTSDKVRWKGEGFNESLVLLDGRLIDRKNIIFNNCN